MGRRTWTDADFVDAVARNTSVSGTLRYLKLAITGANFKTVSSTVRRLDLRTDHWVGQSHRKGKKVQGQLRLPDEAILVENSSYLYTVHLKERLLKSGHLDNKCYVCGQGPSWNGISLVMVLDHISGVRSDNRLSNLRLLCPNCNSQQPTFAGRNIKAGRTYPRCTSCSKQLKRLGKTGKCARCQHKEEPARLYPTKIVWPSPEQLAVLVAQYPLCQVAKQLGVSAVTVKKRCKKLGITTKSPGAWSKIRFGKV